MSRRSIMKFLTVCSLLVGVVLLTSCTETPPPHQANWFYYWKEDKVIDDIEHAEWPWSERFKSTRGVSAPEKTQDKIGLSNASIQPRVVSVRVTNKSDPTISVEVERIGSGGIDSVAITVSHEFRHIWIYQQWKAMIRQTGVIDGRQHTDGDAIPDIVEQDRTSGSIGAKYKFLYDDADTFNMGNQPGWEYYKYYGDNEILAREEGFDNPRSTHPEKDWSVGGKNWER